MKKFLSKLPVMVTFLAVAVVILALYIGILARPVSYGMKYSGTVSYEVGTTNVEYDATYKFKNNKVLSITMTDSNGTTETMDAWYIREGRKVAIAGYSEEAYNDALEEYKAYTQEEKDAFWAEYGININAFKFYNNDTSFVCAGAIVFAVVMGVIELAVITFAVLSTVFFILRKKNDKNAPKTEEVQAA